LIEVFGGEFITKNKNVVYRVLVVLNGIVEQCMGFTKKFPATKGYVMGSTVQTEMLTIEPILMNYSINTIRSEVVVNLIGVSKKIRTPDRFNYTEWNDPYYGYYKYCVENLKTTMLIKERYYNIVSTVEDTFNNAVMSSWRELNNIYVECLVDKFLQIDFYNGVNKLYKIKIRERIKDKQGVFFVSPIVAVCNFDYTVGYCVYYVKADDACLLYRNIQCVKKKENISVVSSAYNSLMNTVANQMKLLEKHAKVLYGFKDSYPEIYKPLISYTRTTLFKALGESKTMTDGNIKALVKNLLSVVPKT
jgi:hypothetical protein